MKEERCLGNPYGPSTSEGDLDFKTSSRMSRLTLPCPLSSIPPCLCVRDEFGRKWHTRVSFFVSTHVCEFFSLYIICNLPTRREGAWCGKRGGRMAHLFVSSLIPWIREVEVSLDVLCGDFEIPRWISLCSGLEILAKPLFVSGLRFGNLA